MSNPIPRIRKDVPLPKGDRERGRPGRPLTPQWAFLRKMEVGESAAFQFEDYDELVSFRNLLNSNASRVGKREEKLFSVRTSEDKTEVAVWRVE